MSTIEIEGFTILKCIGCGGSGEVHLAKHNEMERLVAIKIVKFDDEGNLSKTRCFQEAKILAMISHPNIVPIHDFGRLTINGESYCYFVLEYLEKGALETRVMESKRTNEFEIWTLLQGVAQGLQVAVEHDVIHRDVKPANILLCRLGYAKIGDFGIAKKRTTNKNITEKGYILGTPSFISPETAQTAKNDFRSDIYALGLTAYFCLTKKRPFEKENLIATLLSHTMDLVEAPIIYNSQISLNSNFIIAKMIQKKPQDRYESYGDLLIDIENFLHKRPLRFASMADCRKIYGKDSVKFLSQKRKNTSLFKQITRFIKKSTLLFDNIAVTSMFNIEQRQQKKLGLVHNIKSIMEIECFLDKYRQKNNLIVIDADYQNESSIAIFNLIREKFPQTKLLFITEQVEIANKIEIVCNRDELTSHIKNGKIYKAEEICLPDVAKLVNANSWKVNFTIENGEIKGFCVVDRFKTTQPDISVAATNSNAQ